MGYLLSSDYKKLIKDDIKAVITSSDNSILDDAEVEAQEEISGYIRDKYDITDIFSKTGVDRNPVLIMYMIDIVLYHVHSRIAPSNIPELRVIRYNNAIAWLSDVRKGIINPGFKLRESIDTTNAINIYGHSPKKYDY